MKVALLGDIAFFGRFSLPNNPSLYDYFEKVSEKLKSYDLVIGNFETPFITEDHKTFGYKSAYIGSDPANIELLKYLNVDAVNLANNHIFDYGEESYEYTKQLLDQHNIRFFGIDNKQVVLDEAGVRIALGGFCCYSTNPLGIASASQSGINELEYSRAAEFLEENNRRGYVSIFSVHCGQEHVNFPNYDHIEFARKLSGISPFIFYGHHPHVAQGIELVNDSLIAYSLGNFCFDDVYTSKSKLPLVKQTRNNKESFILELEIDDHKLIRHSVIPIFAGEEEMELNAPEIMEKIRVYSEALREDKHSYISKRSSLLETYLTERRKKRDINWYIKRLNFKSIRMILSARRNARLYRKSVSDQINA
ncbi:CapA family protein [Aureitalea sp. L0-47]|uniref:CapA family protein n=1 Tax=Aureitalea sp. L0-47 TaxID=2816962 RepID=UPI002238B9E9|nr:CapA family protein [Aureitalea sp. L0-47]MCW5520391.1 CapA family protein [Aureitalea sp. L0-47]